MAHDSGGRSMSRRRFGATLLWGGATIAGVGLVPNALADDKDPTRPLIFQSPRVEPFRDELPIIPTVSAATVAVEAATTRHQFHRDFEPSPAMGYSGETYLGPTIEAFRGRRTTVEYRNALTGHPFASDIDTTLHGVTERDRVEIPTSMHLHGGVTPPRYDGHPQMITRPGQGYRHEFPNEHEAGSLWYHDHAMGLTRMNVYAGLAGHYLLRDEFDDGTAANSAGLPSGEFEVALVLQEKLFTDNGHQSIRSTPVVPQGRWEGGAVGDCGVVNGKVWPQMDVARGLYRFRLLNAGSYSLWDLHFENNMQFWVIGAEGGMLDAPAPVRRVRSAPGERVDILVDFSGLNPGETVELLNGEEAPAQAAQIGARRMPRFCRFRALESRGFTGAVPYTLRGGVGQPPLVGPVATPQVVRNVSLSQPTELRIPPSIMSLNNLTFDSDDIETPRQGTVEQWNIVNATNDPHPVHIHLVNFRVVERTPISTLLMAAHDPQLPIGIKWTPDPDAYLAGPARGPEPWETGRKDTVVADPNSVTRIVVTVPTADELGFDPDETFRTDAVTGEVARLDPYLPTDAAAPHLVHGSGHQEFSGISGDYVAPQELRGYVWHCHILDHEDHDMMLGLRFVP